MGVSKNSGTPKSSILIGFSVINHPFWGTTIFGNTHIIFFASLKVNDELFFSFRMAYLIMGYFKLRGCTISVFTCAKV